MSSAISFIPGSDLMTNYKVFEGKSFNPWAGFLNYIIISVGSTACTIYFSRMTAYSVVAYDWKAKKALFTLIMCVLMIPSQVTAIGFFQFMYKIGLVNSFIPMILPSIAAPSVVFFMRQYMQPSLSMDIVQSARIDGAGEFRIFNQIVLPLMKPAIAVQAIFTFVANWNNYFTPALILKDDKKKTLPILIAQLRNADWMKFDMGQVYIMIAFSIFPVIIVYLIMSKYIVAGVALGSVKG
jgi:multiple sugar transport system permease protein